MTAICRSTTTGWRTASDRSHWGGRTASLRAGKRAVAVMSLIQSAKLNGLDSSVYLRDVLNQLPMHGKPHRSPVAAALGASFARSLIGRLTHIAVVAQKDSNLDGTVRRTHEHEGTCSSAVELGSLPNVRWTPRSVSELRHRRHLRNLHRTHGRGVLQRPFPRGTPQAMPWRARSRQTPLGSGHAMSNCRATKWCPHRCPDAANFQCADVRCVRRDAHAYAVLAASVRDRSEITVRSFSLFEPQRSVRCRPHHVSGSITLSPHSMCESRYERSLHSSTRRASRLNATRYCAAFCSFRS